MPYFRTTLEELVYRAAKDGGLDSRIEDTKSRSWYGLLTNGSGIYSWIIKNVPPDVVAKVRSADAEMLAVSFGVIIHEDENHSVTVEIFGTDRELHDRWEAVGKGYITTDVEA